MKPHIKKEIDIIKNNLDYLKIRLEQLSKIADISETQEVYILGAIKDIDLVIGHLDFSKMNF